MMKKRKNALEVYHLWGLRPGRAGQGGQGEPGRRFAGSSPSFAAREYDARDHLVDPYSARGLAEPRRSDNQRRMSMCTVSDVGPRW